LQEVRFAKSLQLIEKNAFEHCESLVGVDLPDSITEIGPESFYCCEGLRKVKLPNGLKVIPSSAFAFCSNIFELKLPEELEIIEANAFGWALEHVDMINFPPKLKQICSGAFEKAADFKTSLKSVTFPPTLERIEHRAFYMNEKLVEAKLLENVKYVASDAFEGCLIGPLDANWESEADQQNKYSISVRQHTFLSGMFCLPTERIDTLVMEDGIVGIPYAYFGESKSPSLFSNGLTQDYGSGVKSIVDKLVLPSSFLDAIPKNRFDTIFLPYPWMRTLDTPENVFGLDWITLTEVEFIHVNSRAYYLPYPLVSRAFISSKPQKNSLSQKAYVDYAKIALDSAMPLPNKAILSIVIAIFHDNLELVDSRPFINFLETHKELLKSQEIQEYCTRHDFSKLYTDLIENQLDYKEPDSKYSEVLKMRKQWDAECALQGEKTVGIQIDIKLKATNKVIENILILIQDVFGLFILFYKNNFFDLISVNKLTTQEIVNNEQTEITIVVRSGLDYLDREINTPFFSHVEFINKLFPEAKMVGCFRINAREYLPFVSNHAGEISAGELQYSFGSDWVFEDSAPPEPVWWNFDDASPDDATVKEYKYYKKIFNKENLFCLNNGNLNRENINYKKGKDGITKLMRASQTGDLTSMKTIIEDGADINNVVSAEGYTALEYAIYAKKYEAIELLLQAGAKLEKKATRWGVTPLMRAANFKLLEIVRLLISGGADIEAVDRDGRTVLLYAIITNSYDIVDLLIREGVNIHTRDRDGKSPLIVAVNGYGDIRIVQLLLDNGGGIELNYDHESGGLALHHAVLNGRIDMVKLLLENGADPTAVKSYTPKGLNAIELAIAKEIKNKDEILGLLMDRHIKE
jgi:ankyrin repeat protein